MQSRTLTAIKSLSRAQEHYSKLAAKYEKEIGEIQASNNPDKARWELLLQKVSLCRLKMQMIGVEIHRYQSTNPDNDPGFQTYSGKVDIMKKQYLQRYCFDPKKSSAENAIEQSNLMKEITDDIWTKVKSARVIVTRQETKIRMENETARKIMETKRKER